MTDDLQWRSLQTRTTYHLAWRERWKALITGRVDFMAEIRVAGPDADKINLHVQVEERETR